MGKITRKHPIHDVIPQMIYLHHPNVETTYTFYGQSKQNPFFLHQDCILSFATLTKKNQYLCAGKITDLHNPYSSHQCMNLAIPKELQAILHKHKEIDYILRTYEI